MSIKNRFEKWFYLEDEEDAETKQAASRRTAYGKGRAETNAITKTIYK